MARRMVGYESDGTRHYGDCHGDEHDWDDECNTWPRCREVEKPDPEEAGVVPVQMLPPPSAYDPPPAHYATDRGIDPWAVWDAFDLDRYTANAVKYLLRAGKKDIAPRLDDLKKARNYINKALELEEMKQRDGD